MKVSKVNQYSVFLLNEPGALKEFTEILVKEGLDIIALSSDIRYEAAIIKFITKDFSEIDTSRIIIKFGYTSVKAEVICIEVKSKPGVIHKISSALSGQGINILTIYGSAIEGVDSRILISVDNIEKALKVLNEMTDL
ncbi:MAG: ACT domain-containing protein [Elusimicrobiota bacterium]|nr:ACT domain-containing protein [Elusimicrobiota bacterium]